MPQEDRDVLMKVLTRVPFMPISLVSLKNSLLTEKSLSPTYQSGWKTLVGNSRAGDTKASAAHSGDRLACHRQTDTDQSTYQHCHL